MQQSQLLDAKFQGNVTDQVNQYISSEQDNGLALPADYSLNNALKAAWFKLQETEDKYHHPVSDKRFVDQKSIAFALMDMAVQGLSPAKNQCYFIVRGGKVQLQRSYFGTVAVLKRLDSVKDIDAQVVHEGDEFEIGSDEVGHLVVKKFVPKFENLDKPLIGAFAFIVMTDGHVAYTVMTKKQIETSWKQSSQRDNKVQRNFSDEMAKRTVINRAAKMIINTSSDSDLLAGSINRTTENEYDNDNQTRKDVTETTSESGKGTPAALLAGLKRKQAAEETPKKAPKQEAPKQADQPKPTKEAPKESSNPDEKPSEDIVKQLTEPDDKIPAEDLPFPETPENGSEGEAVADGQTDIYDYIDEDEAIKDYGDKVGGADNAKD